MLFGRAILEAKANTCAELQIMSGEGGIWCGLPEQINEILLAIANDRVAEIKTHDGPVRWVELKDAANVGRKMGEPAKIRGVERISIYQTNVPTEERATKADKAWPELTKDAKLLKSFSSLQAEQTLCYSTTLLVSVSSIMVSWEEIQLRLKSDVIRYVVRESSANAWLRRSAAHSFNTK
ncbi:MAG: hypothetical protein QOJ02_3140 [Acidobacteriota bacterium]|nr:hypothetical protein [Acidobacteriota bacterium]